ncbi:MAG: hypothetical protein MZW92_70230 [Comamonadaceae bacterium]|nr:hypothetical protein [Comamonadaceae bacterium]
MAVQRVGLGLWRRAGGGPFGSGAAGGGAHCRPGGAPGRVRLLPGHHCARPRLD